MDWKWGPENMLWQVVNNPLQLLDAQYAKEWYAQHSAANWQAGNFLGKSLAVGQDIAGGWVSAWTGSPASAAQSWWGTGLSIPTFFIGGEVGLGLKTINAWKSVTSGLCTAAQALPGGSGVNAGSAALSIVGLTGNFLGFQTKLIPTANSLYLPTSLNIQANGYINWLFESKAIMEKVPLVPEAITRGISVLSFGSKLIDSTFRSINQAINHSVIPNVGGILFENCDAILTDIGEITGAYWDSQIGTLVFVGKDRHKGDMITLRLPVMDRDHLLVALRASLAGQPMGVSIDPPSEYREGINRGVTPPDGTPMLVSYLGNTEHTLFGAIMFEADRLLKCLDKGVHNESKEPVRATVPGFKPLLEMINLDDERPENVWHRFWFVIDKVELKHDPNSNAIAFGDVRLKILTETEKDGQSQEEYVDPTDKVFTQHLTDHYDEYAKDFPILSRLKELAKIAAVAKFLCNQKIPLDIGTLFAEPPQYVETPSTTPGISAARSKVRKWQEGNTIHTHTHTISLFGGVDMAPDPIILPDDGTAKHLKTIAESARPSENAFSWIFRENGFTARAEDIRIGPPSSPFRKICDDHEFFHGGINNLLRLRRIYNSTSTQRGDFGPGWLLWVPFSLTVIPPSGKRPEAITRKETEEARRKIPPLVLHDYTSHTSNLYRSIQAQTNNDQVVFCKVTSQVLKKNETSFEYDPSDCIYMQGNSFWLSRNDCQYHFDSQGYLMQVRTNNRCIVRYRHQNGRIIGFGDDSGHAYDIKYSQSEPRRIIEITDSNGVNIHYSYDEFGYLTSCRSDKENRGSYAYDVQGRLTEVRSHLGTVVLRNTYDDFGNLITKPEDVVVVKSGEKIWRSFHNGQLVSAKDKSGAKLDFKYGKQEELSLVEIKDRLERKWALGYDSEGRLTSLRNPSGQSTKLYYDQSGKVNQISGPDNKPCRFRQDEHGRLIGITDQDNYQWTAEYDNAGHLSAISGPENECWSYEYAGNMLLMARGPAGEVRISPGKDTLTIQTIAPNGTWQKQVIDNNLRQIEYQTKEGNNVQFKYDQLGNMCGIHNEAGDMHYQFNGKELTLEVMF